MLLSGQNESRVGRRRLQRFDGAQSLAVVRQSRRGQLFTLSLRIRRVIRRHARHVTLRVGQRYERLRSNTDTIYTRTPPVEAPSQ